jgi:hypothetical protein
MPLASAIGFITTMSVISFGENPTSRTTASRTDSMCDAISIAHAWYCAG